MRFTSTFFLCGYFWAYISYIGLWWIFFQVFIIFNFYCTNFNTAHFFLLSGYWSYSCLFFLIIEIKGLSDVKGKCENVKGKISFLLSNIYLDVTLFIKINNVKSKIYNRR